MPENKRSEIVSQQNVGDFKTLESWLLGEKELSTDEIYEIVKPLDLKELKAKLNILYSGNTAEKQIIDSRYGMLTTAIEEHLKLNKDQNLRILYTLILGLFFTAVSMYSIQRYAESQFPTKIPPKCIPVETQSSNVEIFGLEKTDSLYADAHKIAQRFEALNLKYHKISIEKEQSQFIPSLIVRIHKNNLIAVEDLETREEISLITKAIYDQNDLVLPQKARETFPNSPSLNAYIIKNYSPLMKEGFSLLLIQQKSAR